MTTARYGTTETVTTQARHAGARTRAADNSPLPSSVIPSYLDHDDHDYNNHDDDPGGRAGAYAGACARAREGAREGAAPKTALTMLAAAYEDAFSRHMPRAVAIEMLRMMQHGAAPELIVAVLDYSTGAPRPSWAYARAVLQRQMAMGTRTAADFAQKEQQRAADRRRREEENPGWQSWGRPKRVIEQMYDQRRYDPGEFEGLSPEQLEELNRYKP